MRDVSYAAPRFPSCISNLFLTTEEIPREEAQEDSDEWHHAVVVMVLNDVGVPGAKVQRCGNR